MERLRRWVTAPVFVVFATACTGGGDPAATAGGEQAAAAPTAVDVILTDFAIDPEMPEVPAEAPIMFTVTNDGQAAHSFAVNAGDESFATDPIDPGATATLEVPGLPPGDYETVCTVAGHADLGMTGALHVLAEEGDRLTRRGRRARHDDPGGDGEGPRARRGRVRRAARDGTDLRPTTGTRPLKPTIVEGVKVFELTTSEVEWEIAPGQVVDAMAFNGRVPGPEIRVRQGDRVRFLVENQMSQPFTLHFHGVTLPNDQDGVPYVTQPPIMPGASWTYEFEIVDPPGMYVYHTHFNAAEQMDRGLYGALIVEPPGGRWQGVYGVEPAVESTVFIGDGTLGYNVNAKSFPATLPTMAKEGQTVLYHMANEGQLLHPMHLHGFHFQVVGIDGVPLAPDDRYMLDTLVVAPGARYDFVVRADEPGIWAFHCHILPHVEGPDGMFGMVTALIVE